MEADQKWLSDLLIYENHFRDAVDDWAMSLNILEQRPSSVRKTFLIYQPFWVSLLNFKETEA